MTCFKTGIRPLTSSLSLLFSCWLILNSGISHASPPTTADLDIDLAIAQEAIRDDDPALAEKVLRRILKSHGKNALPHRLLGELLLKKNQGEAAIAEFTTALHLDPQDELSREYLFSVYYNRAQTLLENPQEAFKARPELEKAIEIRPDGVLSYYFLGILNYQENRDADCIASLLKVADTIPEKLHPNLHAMLYNSTLNLLTQKKAIMAKDALPYFSRPQQAPINELLLVATVALETDQFSESIGLYDRILEKDPQHPLARHNRAIAQERLLLHEQQKEKTAGQHPLPLPSPAGNSDKSSASPVSSEL